MIIQQLISQAVQELFPDSDLGLEDLVIRKTPAKFAVRSPSLSFNTANIERMLKGGESEELSQVISRKLLDSHYVIDSTAIGSYVNLVINAELFIKDTRINLKNTGREFHLIFAGSLQDLKTLGRYRTLMGDLLSVREDTLVFDFQDLEITQHLTNHPTAKSRSDEFNDTDMSKMELFRHIRHNPQSIRDAVERIARACGFQRVTGLEVPDTEFLRQVSNSVLLENYSYSPWLALNFNSKEIELVTGMGYATSFLSVLRLAIRAYEQGKLPILIHGRLTGYPLLDAFCDLLSGNNLPAISIEKGTLPSLNLVADGKASADDLLWTNYVYSSLKLG